MRAAIAAATVLACIACLAPAAGATTMTARAGAVVAKLRYHSPESYSWVTDRLTITRDGKKLVDRKPRPKACRPNVCGPTPGYGERPIVARDLDADGEPEVVYTSFWGGAHCCTIGQVYRYDARRHDYRSVSRNFGDPGYRLRDLEGDGRVEWMSADWRFDYEFASYAASGQPIQIWHFRHGRFRDVTNRYPGRIRRDGRAWWRRYRRIRHRHDGEQCGQVAAWAADKYRLGRRRQALRILHREARRGNLERRRSEFDPARHGRKFVRRLDRFLRRRGY